MFKKIGEEQILNYPVGKIVNVLGAKTNSTKPSEDSLRILAADYIKRNGCDTVTLVVHGTDIKRTFTKKELEL